MGTNGNHHDKQNTVLVIEDDPCINELLQTVFKEEGYQTVPAFDGVTALELAHRVNPQLITLDLALPMADGCHVLESLKQDDSTRDIPVIVLSAYTDSLYRNAREMAARVVEKPFDLSDLLAAVAEACGQS